MLVKEWFTVGELVTNFAVSKTRIYNAISALRRAHVIETQRNPDNYRAVLIKATDLPALRRFLRIDSSQHQSAS